VATTRSLKTAPGKSAVRRQCLSTAQIGLHHRVVPTKRLTTPRAFSTYAPRKFADADESFDPKSIERESDEVDVVIVGGGRSFPTTLGIIPIIKLFQVRPALAQRFD
jgi:hypothetical protein